MSRNTIDRELEANIAAIQVDPGSTPAALAFVCSTFFIYCPLAGFGCATQECSSDCQLANSKLFT